MNVGQYRSSSALGAAHAQDSVLLDLSAAHARDSDSPLLELDAAQTGYR